MKTKIVASITASTMDEARRDIDRASQVGADIVELRLDYWKERPDLNRLSSTCGLYELPMIITIRAKDEGGHEGGYFASLEEKRLEKERIESLERADYADFELKHYIEFPKGETKIIVSWHDFERTPSEEELEEIYQKISQTNADIIKIAAQANRREDVDRMIKLLENHASERDMIIISMGEIGKRTRLHPENFLTFACLEKGKASADGQFTVAEIRQHLQGICREEEE